jgi:hypothetical protein
MYGHTLLRGYVWAVVIAIYQKIEKNPISIKKSIQIK